jgi:predicted aspartyl protease
VVQLPVLAIGGLRLARVNAVVLDMPGTLAGSGLLGMNVLSRWNLQIDGQNGRLILQSGSGGGR